MTAIFQDFVTLTKAQRYDTVAYHNRELREIRDALIDALELSLRQLDDPDEDIVAIRNNARIAIERAKRV